MKTTKGIDEGFNHIKPWLSRKLKERQMTVDDFCIASGDVLNPTAIRRWYSDACRPYPESMKLVCKVLSSIPLITTDGSKRFEEVPWSEGMAKYRPKPRAWEAHYLSKPTPQQ